MCPAPAAAYVGPGAGFAVLSSFLAVFLGFLYSLVAALTWPVRQVRRFLRSRRALRRASIRRLIILGLDGLDPGLATRYMEEGKLPNLAKLRDSGTFCPLETTTPPISPVAWSSFQTGVNPGKHNIFDFLTRDQGTYLPRLSSAQIRGPRRTLKIGKYNIPLGRSQIRLLRKARPFWHYLGEAGVFSSVLRVPITFPPERFAGVLLSGMCVPDLAGTQGTFAFYSTREHPAGESNAGMRFRLERAGEWLRSFVSGPPNPLLANGSAALQVPFRIRPGSSGEALLEIQKQSLRLRTREYSEWVELKFKAAPGFSVYGICRFYLKQALPETELYVTPVNIHPGKPALPISHPFTYSVYLSKLLRPFATLGLAEDTWALNEGVLDDESFLRQCYLIHEERERMFFDAVDKTRTGVIICVFDATDRIQHMFWRYLQEGHPAAAKNQDAGLCRDPIEDLYRRIDELVGRTLERMDQRSILLAISDHGFKPFERSLNLNTWLRQNGYLALKEGRQRSGDWFADVDWQRTRAYALGLGGLYINQKGRERSGTVAPGAETEQLKEELCGRLKGLRDPKDGRIAILELLDARRVYRGSYRENAPDLIVGYNEGYRAGWDSVTGRVTSEVFEDNCKAWSGDHCIHPHKVPGVLFCNRKLECRRPSILDIAPTALDLFGIPIPPHFDGSPWGLA